MFERSSAEGVSGNRSELTREVMEMKFPNLLEDEQVGAEARLREQKARIEEIIEKINSAMNDPHISPEYRTKYQEELIDINKRLGELDRMLYQVTTPLRAEE